MISVLILTKNEEHDLPACLASVAWCDDVHVFDSYSQDRTVEVATAAGATVTQRRFDGYASQRNAALREVAYRHEWLLILDADEQVPAATAAALQAAARAAPAPVAGFRLRRRDYLYDQWLRRAQISPYFIRLVRHQRAHYQREINEVLEISGEVRNLDLYFNHFPFSKGIGHWLSKHNQYSSMEAVRWLEEHEQQLAFSVREALFGRDVTRRRYHQKGLFYKLPARPLVKWLYMMLGRGAFLDGRAGVTYATLQAIYEYFIVLKTKELLRRPQPARTLA